MIVTASSGARKLSPYSVQISLPDTLPFAAHAEAETVRPRV